MIDFKQGDNIQVCNDKLKTNGLYGIVEGKHYNDYYHGSYFNGCYDVKLHNDNTEILTFINHNNLKLVTINT